MGGVTILTAVQWPTLTALPAHACSEDPPSYPTRKEHGLGPCRHNREALQSGKASMAESSEPRLDVHIEAAARQKLRTLLYSRRGDCGESTKIRQLHSRPGTIRSYIHPAQGWLLGNCGCVVDHCRIRYSRTPCRSTTISGNETPGDHPHFSGCTCAEL
jgi:hypothetical protein